MARDSSPPCFGTTSFCSCGRRVLAVASMVVLLEDSGLWTRFTRVSGGYSSQVHVPAAGPGEIAIVSNEAVISRILDGRLSAGHAIDTGLIAVDAPPAEEDGVRDLLVAAFDVRLPVEGGADLVSRRTPWRGLGH